MNNIDKQELREAAERAESDSWGFDRDEFNEALTPSTVLALLDELEAAEKLNAELMEKQRLIDICQGQGLEHRIAAEKRAEAAEKRIAELEAREVKLNDINEYLAEIHDKTLNRAFRLLAEGVRAGDVASIRAAGINIAAAGKGE
nr:MAG TPA_asm: Ead/Ea22-like protein [Caudoviricetes sp.]